MRFAREQRTQSDEGGDLTWDVWSVHLIARDRHRPLLRLPHFEFRCDTVSRSDAAALAQQLAHRLKLPLHIEDEAAEQNKP